MTVHGCDNYGPGGTCSYCGPRSSTAHPLRPESVDQLTGHLHCPLCATDDPAFWSVWDDDPEEDDL